MGILQSRILEWVVMSSLQWIFPTQRLNPSLPYCRQILYCLSHQESPEETGVLIIILKATFPNSHRSNLVQNNKQKHQLNRVGRPEMESSHALWRWQNPTGRTMTLLSSWQQFSQWKAIDSVNWSSPNFLFPFIKEFSLPFLLGICMWLTIVANQEFQFIVDSK